MSQDSRPEAHSEEAGASLEDRLRRLEQIVGVLEGDELGLDAALELFEEGVGHVRHAERILAEAELKVEELIGRGEDDGMTGQGPEAP